MSGFFFEREIGYFMHVLLYLAFEIFIFDTNLLTMKKYFSFIVLIVLPVIHSLSADLVTDLVKLSKIYKSNMFGTASNAKAMDDLAKIETPELSSTVEFIRETITPMNKLATIDFLKMPDDSTLKYIFVIWKLNNNMFEKTPRDNFEVANEFRAAENSRYEMVDCYYNLLMIGIGNKNQPFNMSAIDFDMDAYEFKDDTERGIFFLQAMDLCGTVIWGYMNIVNPPNYKDAYSLIALFPKFNGQEYFRYDEFSFTDFEMVIEKDKGITSYKSYYINKYYDVLLAHLDCLSQKKKYAEARQQLLVGSILKDERFYEYSKKKSRLESLFETIEK